MSRTPRMTGARLWLCSLVLAVATYAGLRSLTGVVQDGSWVGTGTWALLLLALLLAGLRSVLRSPLAPTAWGLLAAVLGVAGQYGGLTTSFTIPRPTSETVERIRLLVAQGEQTIVEGRVPVPPTRGLEMLVVVGVLAVYLVAELIAVGFGRGALAGLPVLTLWAAAIGYEARLATPLLLVGGASYLLLLALTRRRPRRRELGWARETTTALAASVAVTVVALVLGNAASALPFAGSMELPSSWGGAERIDSPLRLSTDLDMRSDLEGRSDRPLLEYRGSSLTVGALRTHTLASFDGEEWLRGTRTTSFLPSTGLLWPDDPGTVAEPVTVPVRVLALDGDHLPVPVEPREVSADGVWFYDRQRDEVIGSDTTVRGLEYEVTVSARVLSGATLQQDAVGQPPGGLAQYLDVPETEHAADIRALAQELTAEAPTDYDRVVALQTYLRSSQNFTYDTELAPPQTTDAVWDFLTSGRGYCVQFATAMTIMARSIGLPTRMAIGFLPGSPAEDRPGTYVVTARDAHAWPEVYFEGAGWVRFEPTPAAQTGPPPRYADPLAPDPLNNPNIPSGVPTATAAPTTGSVPGQGGGGGYVGIGDAEMPVAAFVAVLAAVALVVLVVALWLLRRRRRRRAIPHGPEEWWARLREDLAEHGVQWTEATTPRQAAHLIRSARPAPEATAGSGVPDGAGAAFVVVDAHPGVSGQDRSADATVLREADAALDRLVAAVESERYAPHRPEVTPEELAAWVAAVAEPFATVGATVEED